MSAEDKRDATTTNIIYSLVPAQPLPVVDLSKSFRGRLIPDNVHTYIRRRYYKYNRHILLCAVVSCGINFIVPMVKAPVGHVLSFLAVLLWLPMGLGSITTLRYDIVRLVCRTFDFWFFSIVTSMIVITMSMYFGDLRSVRTMIDWFGYHHVICVDAHVLGLRKLTFFLIAAIFSSLVALTWMMCGQVDGGSSFSIVEYQTNHGNFSLSGLDVIGNGLVSLWFLLAKIVFRRRKVLHIRRKRSEVVECIIYRCKLMMQPVQGPLLSSAWKTNDFKFDSKVTSMRDADTVQHLMFVNFSQTFNSSNTLLPRSIVNRIRFSPWMIVVLYLIGAAGLLLSQVALAYEFYESSDGGDTHEKLIFMVSLSALVLTVVLTSLVAMHYQRRLLKLLFTSFDFVFYSFQITSASISVCTLYNWNVSHCIMVLSWWLWAHWVFTLDALTPVMREMLQFRVRFAAVVICILLADHVAIVCKIFFAGDLELRDSVIFDGTVWGQHLSFRVIPFYVSRSVTLLLWCSRLICRLASASNNDVIILRGTVCYDNFFTKGRRKSLQIAQAVKVKALAAALSRRAKISPVMSSHQDQSLK